MNILATDFSSTKFIDTINTELENLNNQITTQKEKKEYIIKFIDNINNLIEDKHSQIENQKLYEIRENANKILGQVNENIDLLFSLSSSIKELNQVITDFFSSSTEENCNSAKLQEIESSINSYFDIVKQANEKILLNDIKIDYFVENSISKNFIADFQLSSGNEQIRFEDNSTLVVSEIKNEVLLPYKVSEVNEYLNQFPDSYNSFEDVIKKEFILPLTYYMRHPSISRFREAYALIRDRESKSIIEALKYALDLMFKYELNPTIIAACKTQEQLEHYLECLRSNKLDDFKDFEIKFEINPI